MLKNKNVAVSFEVSKLALCILLKTTTFAINRLVGLLFVINTDIPLDALFT